MGGGGMGVVPLALGGIDALIGGAMASTLRKPITGVWGQSSQRGQPGQSKRGKAP